MVDMERMLSTPSGATTVQEFLDPDHIERALATRAIYFTLRVYTMLTESDAPSKTKQNELFALEVNRMTNLHLIYKMYELSRKRITDLNLADKNITKIFMTAFACFGLKQIQ